MASYTPDNIMIAFIGFSTLVETKTKEEVDKIRNEIYDMSPTTQILCKRLDEADIGIKLDPIAGYIISLCASGNPGMSIMILYEGIKRARNNMDMNIDTFDIKAFAAAYPDDFPIIYNTGCGEVFRYDNDSDVFTPIGKEFSELWDNQKIYNQTDEMLQKCNIPKDGMSDNMVDYIPYWKLLVEEPAT